MDLALELWKHRNLMLAHLGDQLCRYSQSERKMVYSPAMAALYALREDQSESALCNALKYLKPLTTCAWLYRGPGHSRVHNSYDQALASAMEKYNA